MTSLASFALAAALVSANPATDANPPVTATTPAPSQKAAKPTVPVKLPAVCDGLEKNGNGKILVIEVKDADDNPGARTCGFIAAQPQEVYDALSDYETFPRWMDKVKKIELEWKDAKTANVTYEIGTFVGSFTYVLERLHYPPKRVTWTKIGGDFKLIVGSYDFYPVDGGTVLILESYVDPGVYMPGFVESHFREKGARRIIEDVRNEVKRRQK